MKVARQRLQRQNRTVHPDMNSPEDQLASNSRMTYIDPEQADTSEQQFAVSLEQKPSSAFVIDPEGAVFAPKNASQAGSLIRTREDVEQDQSSGSSNGVARDRPTNSSLLEGARELATDWRDLVSAKVSNYRSRRPRKERYPSLQLPFDPDFYRRSQAENQSSAFENFAEPDRQAFASAPLRVSEAPPVFMEATARVLEFPRPAAPPPRVDELADPVLDRPRIIEAPELLPPPPAMGGILIEPAAQPEPERRPGFEVPLHSASLERRTAAGMADIMLVAVAAAAFAYIALRIIGSKPPLRGELFGLAGLLAILWSAYQYAFLVFCGRTPGLLLAGLAIQKFDGRRATRTLRRWRVLASILSLASLGLGYAWCFLDEDQLCWHDRITRTHLAMASRAGNQERI